VRNFRKFALELRAAWHLAIEYRIAVVIWLFTMMLPLIMMAAWLSMTEGGPIGRFGRGDFIAYYLAAVLIRNITGVWIIWEQVC
jgi:ABC-2 type transport system permease protein